MKLHGQTLQQIAGAYALGTLSTQARRRFETMLERDVAARRALQQCEERLAGIASEIPSVRPPDNTWQAIEQRLAQKAAPRARSSRIWWLVVALALSVALVLFRARFIKP